MGPHMPDPRPKHALNMPYTYPRYAPQNPKTPKPREWAIKQRHNLQLLTNFWTEIMSANDNPAKNSLGVPDADGKGTGSKRKMTAAIIEDQ